MGDFPNQVQVQQAPAVEGDFASKNPRFSYNAGPGGLVAGPGGCLVGRFGWATAPLDGDGAPASVTNSGFGLPSGFVHREQQALITAYLGASGMLIQPGFGMTLMITADFWVRNAGSSEALYGQKAYASFADGSVTFAATASPTNSATSSASSIAAGSTTFTGAFSGNVLTASAVTGTITNGQNLAGTGVPSGTQVVKQLTGTTGGAGTYLLNVGELSLTAVSVTGTYGILTVGGTVTGAFAVGQAVTGSGVTAGMSITQLGTGTGAAGTYFTNVSQTLSSQAINGTGNIETKYIARSTGLPGELVKISPNANA